MDIIHALKKDVGESINLDNLQICIVFKTGDLIKEVDGTLLEVDSDNAWIKVKKAYGSILCVSSSCLLSYELLLDNLSMRQTITDFVAIIDTPYTFDEETLIEEVENEIRSCQEIKHGLEILIPYYNKVKHVNDEVLKELNKLCNQIKNKFNDALKNKNPEKIRDAFEVLKLNSKFATYPEYKNNYLVLSLELDEYDPNFLNYLAYLSLSENSPLTECIYHKLLFIRYQEANKGKSLYHLIKWIALDPSFPKEALCNAVKIIANEGAIDYFLALVTDAKITQHNSLIKYLIYLLFKNNQRALAKQIFLHQDDKDKVLELKSNIATSSIVQELNPYNIEEIEEDMLKGTIVKDINYQIQREIIQKNIKTKPINFQQFDKKYFEEVEGNEDKDVNVYFKDLLNECYEKETIEELHNLFISFPEEVHNAIFLEDAKAINIIRDLLRQLSATITKDSYDKKKEAFKKWENQIKTIQKKFSRESSQYSDYYNDITSFIANEGPKWYVRKMTEQHFPKIEIIVNGESVIKNRNFIASINFKNCVENSQVLGPFHLHVLNKHGDIVAKTQSIIINDKIKPGETINAKVEFEIVSKIISIGTHDFEIKYETVDENGWKHNYESGISINLIKNPEFIEIPNPYKAYAEKGLVKYKKYFWGRDKLLSEICDQIEIEGDKVLYLLGDEAYGKTSFAFHLNKILSTTATIVMAVDAMDILAGDHINLGKEMAFLRGEMKDEELNTISQKRLLIIDNLELLLEAIARKRCSPELFTELVECTIGHASYILFLGKPEIKEFQESAPDFFGNFSNFHLTNITYDGVCEALKTFLNSIGNNISVNCSEDWVIQLTGGNPFIIQNLFSYTIDYLNDNMIDEINLTDIQNIEDVIVSSLKDKLLHLLAGNHNEETLIELTNIIKGMTNVDFRSNLLLNELKDKGYVEQKENSVNFKSKIIQRIITST